MSQMKLRLSATTLAKKYVGDRQCGERFRRKPPLTITRVVGWLRPKNAPQLLLKNKLRKAVHHGLLIAACDLFHELSSLVSLAVAEF